MLTEVEIERLIQDGRDYYNLGHPKEYPGENELSEEAYWWFIGWEIEEYRFNQEKHLLRHSE